MKKRRIIIIAVIALAFLVFALGSSDETESDTTSAPAPESTESAEEDQRQAIRDELKERISLTGPSKVRNDVTGNWRISMIVTSETPEDYAKEYYEACFESDDEIHAVVNFTLNTTTKITLTGDSLLIDVYEYVDGEEHDAKMLFGGMPLDSMVISLTDE